MRYDHTARRSRRPVRHLAVLLVIVLLASACGGKKAGERTERASENSRLGTGEPESGLEDAGEPVRGGTLRYGLEAETGGGFCLPEGQLAISGMMVVRALYDTLTVTNRDGRFVPYLAKSLTHNADHTVWDIEVREGVRFHDGSALDATVVKNNIDAYRGKYPARAGLLGPFVLQDIDTVTVTGPMTVQVKTKRPWIAFPAYLNGGSRYGIMAQAQLDDPETCDTKPIGTGPFVFESWTPNQKLVAKRNPGYWQEAPDGEPYPYADAIEFQPIPESQQRNNALESGSINAMHTSSPLDLGGPLRELREAGKANMFVSEDFAEVGYLMLNASKPPFDDERMRRAFAMAIDREEVNTVLAEGLPTVADGPFPPGSPAHLSDPGFPKHDPAEARRLVDEYVRGGGSPEFTLTMATGSTIQQLGELLQQQAKAAGITMRLTNAEQATLINTAIGGTYQALTFRNHPASDPDTQYVWWYGKANPVNFGRINDPVIDDLLDRGRSEPDPAKRQQMYEELNRQFARKVWNVWMSYTTWGIVVADNVHGILGPDLPDGSKPSTGLATGHHLLGMWVDEG